MRAATFQDAITQFINECAALPAALLQSAAHHARAWSVTVTGLAADTILFAYLLHRAGGRNWRNSLPVVIHPFLVPACERGLAVA